MRRRAIGKGAAALAATGVVIVGLLALGSLTGTLPISGLGSNSVSSSASARQTTTGVPQKESFSYIPAAALVQVSCPNQGQYQGESFYCTFNWIGLANQSLTASMTVSSAFEYYSVFGEGVHQENATFIFSELACQACASNPSSPGTGPQPTTSFSLAPNQVSGFTMYGGLGKIEDEGTFGFQLPSNSTPLNLTLVFYAYDVGNSSIHFSHVYTLRWSLQSNSIISVVPQLTPIPNLCALPLAPRFIEPSSILAQMNGTVTSGGSRGCGGGSFGWDEVNGYAEVGALPIGAPMAGVYFPYMLNLSKLHPGESVFVQIVDITQDTVLFSTAGNVTASTNGISKFGIIFENVNSPTFTQAQLETFVNRGVIPGGVVTQTGDKLALIVSATA